jgi:hypothetical protein
VQVNTLGLWVLLGVCSLGGLVWALPRELRGVRWREGRLRFGGALAGAVLTGVGAGLSVALAATVLGAVLARLG